MTCLCGKQTKLVAQNVVDVCVELGRKLKVTASAYIQVLFACKFRTCRDVYAKLVVHVAERCYEFGLTL